MKVKTLYNSMLYPTDEAEIYTDNMDLISRCDEKTLINVYGEYRVKKFYVYEDGITTVLELILY